MSAALRSRPAPAVGAAVPAQPVVSTLPALDPGSLLHLLLRAAVPNLPTDELQRLARDVPDHAAELAGRAALVASGIAHLVQSDAPPDGPAAGNFQSAADVPELLLHLADTLTHVAALASLASEAQSYLRERGAA